MSLFGKKRQPEHSSSEMNYVDGPLMSREEMHAHFSQIQFIAYDVDRGDYVVPQKSPQAVKYGHLVRELVTLPITYEAPETTIYRLWQWFSRASLQNLKEIDIILQNDTQLEVKRLENHAGHIGEYLSRGVIGEKELAEVVAYVRGLFQL